MNLNPDYIARFKAKLEQDPDQSFRYHSRVSTQYRFICLTVPKVACSRIKLTLHLLEENEAPEHIGTVHNLGLRLTNFDLPKLVDMLTAPGWFRFCFVRNPYDRLVSAYNTQIGNMWNEQYTWLKEDIRSTFGYPPSQPNQSELVSFRDFVRFLKSAPERVWRDGHFNLQTRILMPDLIQYDFVGRFENFAADFSTALKMIGVPPSIIDTAHEIINPTYKVQLPLVFDQTLADLVYNMYQADFEQYGYAPHSWRLER